MHAYERQRGSGKKRLLVILAVVAVLVFVGLRLLSDRNPAASPTQTPVKTTTSKEQPATDTPAPEPKYLIIREWGVKLKIAEADRLTYLMQGTPGGGPDTNGRTSYATIMFNGSLAVPDDCRPLGPVAGQYVSAGDRTKIGRFYYSFQGTATPCGNDALDALRTTIVNELVLSAFSAQ